jgi:hypothetical protein
VVTKIHSIPSAFLYFSFFLSLFLSFFQVSSSRKGFSLKVFF